MIHNPQVAMVVVMVMASFGPTAVTTSEAQTESVHPPPTVVILPAGRELREIRLPLYQGRVRIGTQDDWGTANRRVNHTAERLNAHQQWANDLDAHLRAYTSLLYLKRRADRIATLDRDAFPLHPEGSDHAAVMAFNEVATLRSEVIGLGAAAMNEAGWRHYFCTAQDAACDATISTMGVVATGRGARVPTLGGFNGTEFDQRDAYRAFMAEAVPAIMDAAQSLPEELLYVARLLLPAYDFQTGTFALSLATAMQATVMGGLAHKAVAPWEASLADFRARTMLPVPEAKARQVAELGAVWIAMPVRLDVPDVSSGMPVFPFHVVGQEMEVFEDGALTRSLGTVRLGAASPSGGRS